MATAKKTKVGLEVTLVNATIDAAPEKRLSKSVDIGARVCLTIKKEAE